MIGLDEAKPRSNSDIELVLKLRSEIENILRHPEFGRSVPLAAPIKKELGIGPYLSPQPKKSNLPSCENTSRPSA